jgi:hypothetical protein
MPNQTLKLFGLISACFLLLVAATGADEPATEPEVPEVVKNARAAAEQSGRTAEEQDAEAVKKRTEAMANEARRQRENERRKMENAPTVSVRGKVFLPDGSPATNVTVQLMTMPHKIGVPGLLNTDAQGEYSCELQVGTWLVARAQTWRKINDRECLSLPSALAYFNIGI